MSLLLVVHDLRWGLLMVYAGTGSIVYVATWSTGTPSKQQVYPLVDEPWLTRAPYFTGKLPWKPSISMGENFHCQVRSAKSKSSDFNDRRNALWKSIWQWVLRNLVMPARYPPLDQNRNVIPPVRKCPVVWLPSINSLLLQLDYQIINHCLQIIPNHQSCSFQHAPNTNNKVAI